MLQKKDSSKDPLFKEATFRIANRIFDHPNSSFHLRELAEGADMSTTGTVSAIGSLKELRLVKVEKTRLTTNIKANLESDKYSYFKRIFNLYLLERSLLLDDIRKHLRPKVIVLFGSYARGEDVEQSDIDLLIITNSKSRIPVEKYEKTLKRKINMHILQSLDKSSNEFKNAVANGVVIEGYLKIL